MLNQEEIKKGIETILKWFEDEPHKDSPAIVSAGGGLSPRNIKEEVEKRKVSGKWPKDIITEIVLSAGKDDGKR